MARPVTIDDKRLLECAREVFLEKGFSATTSEVAKRAGVSEGILFHRFGSKAALFEAAMSVDVVQLEHALDLDARVGRSSLAGELSDILTVLIRYLRIQMPCNMMSWSNRAESGHLPPLLTAPDPPPLRIVRHLAHYFEQEITAGRMRRVDAVILARLCAGSASHFVFMETVGAAHGLAPTDDASYVHSVVDTLLHGATARS
jgi:AcrR family transcriptional regulator